ncbi:MAG TPA: serine/threonine-protein kinase, partial [Prosthecobacter sp.]|nr:serine/threonine-protein kinase [Prosthecobacter sp.]
MQRLSSPSTPHPDAPRSSLTGLDPVGLIDAVIGSDEGVWQPPPPEVLEPVFMGFDHFDFIDRGGMGAVYSARQKSLDRRVAIKILPPELGQDDNFVDRFHQEARLLAKLQHPNIVTVYDFGSTPAGHLFIVMEHVQGKSLLALMKEKAIGPLRSIEIACQVCDALQFAHEHGIVHRDIKPTNILVDDRGKVRVADFGLAKLAGSNLVHITTARTQAGRAIGTPGYAAPEQRRAEPAVDCRADIFSLGVTLYEMLTGHTPVGVFESPSRKAGTPPALDRVVLRALQERPELRYQSAAQMKKAIEMIATKLGAPGFRRRILQRPLTAAVILIQLLVTGWLLSDKLTRTPDETAVFESASSTG